MTELEALGNGLEGLPVAALLSDLVTGTAIGANAAAGDLLGRSADELIGSDVISFVHPDERGAASSGVTAMAAGAIDAFQVRQRRVVRADGTPVTVDVSGRRLDSATQQLALWVFARAEQDITLGCVGRTGKVVLAVTDHDWQLEYISVDPGLLGAGTEALVGTALLGLVHPSAVPEFLQAASHAVGNRITVSLSTRLRSGTHEWADRYCLLAPMCVHAPPRLGIVVTAIAAASGGESADVIAANIHHTALDTRRADALFTLAAFNDQTRLPELSARQVEILSMVARGDAVDTIASALYLSPSTVRNHLTALYRKFGVHSRSALLAELLRASLALDPSR